jgi:hypothetical protein
MGVPIIPTLLLPEDTVGHRAVSVITMGDEFIKLHRNLRSEYTELTSDVYLQHNGSLLETILASLCS